MITPVYVEIMDINSNFQITTIYHQPHKVESKRYDGSKRAAAKYFMQKFYCVVFLCYSTINMRFRFYI